jgi:hypothetical protein
MTGARQTILVALIVVIGAYPAGHWLADRIFNHFAESAALAIMADPLVLDAIRQQNVALQPQTQAELDVIDKQWIEERKNPAGQLTAAMLATPVSRQLRALVAGSHGALTHAILMDNRGRNVGVADPTTDYWQGDEAKFLNTAAIGSSDVQRGDIERRHDGKGAACWLSRTIFEAGKPIGALAVEVNLDHVPPFVCAERR